MTVKQVMKKYGCDSPQNTDGSCDLLVRLIADDEDVFIGRLSEIPKYYWRYDRVRFHSGFAEESTLNLKHGIAGKFLMVLWAYAPDSHFLPEMCYYPTLSEFFHDYCKELDWTFLGFEYKEPFYLIFYLNEEVEKRAELLFDNEFLGVPDLIPLCSCSAEDENSEALGTLRVVYEALVRLYGRS